MGRTGRGLMADGVLSTYSGPGNGQPLYIQRKLRLKKLGSTLSCNWPVAELGFKLILALKPNMPLLGRTCSPNPLPSSSGHFLMPPQAQLGQGHHPNYFFVPFSSHTFPNPNYHPYQRAGDEELRFRAEGEEEVG